MRRALIWVVCFLPGCGVSGGVGSPRAALARLSDVIGREDTAGLHAMLPTRLQRSESVDALRARLADDRAEVRALGVAVSEALSRRHLARVEVTLRSSGAVPLEEGVEGWRVEDPGMTLTAATSIDGIVGARAALRALHVLLRRHGAGAWARVLSSRALGNVSADIAALIEGTEAPSALEYTSSQSTIRFRLPDGREAVTIFEDGAWRVDAVREAE